VIPRIATQMHSLRFASKRRILTDRCSNSLTVLTINSEQAQFAADTKRQGIERMLSEVRSGRQIGRASIAAFAVLVVGAGVTYAAQLLTARVIGPESYGMYAYALAWVTILSYISTLGFHVSLLRFVPFYRAKNQWPLVRGVIEYSERSATGAAIIIALIGVCGTLIFNGSVRPEIAHTFLVGMFVVPLFALRLVSASAVRAFGGVVASLAPERIARDSLLIAILAVAFWSNLWRLDAVLAMGAMLVSSFVILGQIRMSLRRLRPPALKCAKPAFTPKDWWPPTLPLSVITVADNLMTRSGIIALGLVGSTKEAGIFAVALSMATFMALPRMAVAIAFQPTVSALFALQDKAGLQSLIARAAGLSLLGTASGAIPLLLFAKPLLSWFGHDFVSGAPSVTLLVLGQLFAAACGPQQHLFTMTGHQGTGAAILAICAGLNFAACMLMIVPIGMIGAAIGMAGAMVAWNVAMGIFIYKRLQLVPGLVAWFRLKPAAIISG
jgi:O-antigen/teichoic acid export membrane protein